MLYPCAALVDAVSSACKGKLTHQAYVFRWVRPQRDQVFNCMCICMRVPHRGGSFPIRDRMNWNDLTLLSVTALTQIVAKLDECSGIRLHGRVSRCWESEHTRVELGVEGVS